MYMPIYIYTHTRTHTAKLINFLGNPIRCDSSVRDWKCVHRLREGGAGVGGGKTRVDMKISVRLLRDSGGGGKCLTGSGFGRNTILLCTQ